MSKIMKQRENSNSTNQNSVLWHGKSIQTVKTFVFDTVRCEGGFVSFQSPKNVLIGWTRVVDFEH